MSWLYQPAFMPTAPAVVDIPRGIPMGNRAWLWDGLAATAARLRAAPLPAVGPAVASTLILNIQAGCKLTLEWATDVAKSWNGLEQRVATLGAPRLRIDGQALLVDGADRTIRVQLLTAAASGSAFLLGLPYEELTVAADSTGTVVTVYSTTYADWLQPGQRCIVVDRDGSIPNRSGFVVQSSSPTTITLDASCVVKAGGRIMPATAVYLEPQQGLGRHVVNLTEWHVAARGAEFGFANVDTMGVNGAVTSIVDPIDAVERLIWDHRDLDDVADDSMQSLAEIVDLGGIPMGIGSANEPDWGRQVQYSGSGGLPWQWLKSFLYQTRGRQKTFLLPTWRPDMVYVSEGVATLTVESAEVEGAGDVVSYLDNSSTRRIAVLYTDSSVSYHGIVAYADNLDGTTTIDLDDSLAGGTVEMICWLELVRWENDQHQPTWTGDVFEFTAMARVVQQ